MMVPSFLRFALTGSIVVAALACGGSSTAAPDPGNVAPSGPDTETPFPIDRGGDGGGASAPGSYKHLPLRLTDNGEPTVTPVSGIIGVVCVGMSNADQECADYQDRIRRDYVGQVNAAVRVVNCAVGGHAIERWNDAAFDSTLWASCVGRKLSQAGVTVGQVRVIYHKAANQFTTASGNRELPVYPVAGSDYENFVRNLSTFAGRVKAKFPAVQAVYTSSRSYGGFAGTPGRGEPLSYEEGHALNTWLAANRSVDGVWYGWGPYLWAPSCSSGVMNKGGVCYVREDYVSDGVHPSPLGEAKMSLLIHSRFREHAWYR